MTLPDWSDAKLQAVAPLIDGWASTYGLPVEIAYGLVSQESRFIPNATGSLGERGLTQIMPSTAKAIGYQGTDDGLYDPNTNLAWGLYYLAQQVGRFGDIDSALSAYNGGFKKGEITNPAYVNGVHQRAQYFLDQWSAMGTETPPQPEEQPLSWPVAVIGGTMLLTALYHWATNK